MTSDAILAKALTAIPVEPWSIPVCDRPAAAVVRQEDGAVFLVCERHLEKGDRVRVRDRAPGRGGARVGAARARRRPRRVGDPAPEIRLPSLGPTGVGEVVPVSEVAHGRPIALAFGSYSAPKFRRNLPAVEDVHRRYADRVSLFLVYAQEVRPAGATVQASGRFPGAPATIEAFRPDELAAAVEQELS